MSSITLYSLSDYNNGTLIPFTIELDGISYDDYLIEIAENLEKIDEKYGLKEDEYPREEWIVCDYEDIPSQFIGEYDLSEDFFEFQEAIEASYYDKEVFEAAINCGVPLDKIENLYAGEFNSDADFAYDFVESTGMLQDVPDSIANYFDYESFGRDLAMDYTESNGHYFNTNY